MNIHNVDLQTSVLKIFNALLVSDNSERGSVNADLATSLGVVTDFPLNDSTKKVLKSYFEPLKVKTLFSREERENSNIEELILKQVLHYVEVYGLRTPGLFDLEVSDGHILSMKFVKGITVSELGDMVRKLIYTNAPFKDTEDLHSIIKTLKIEFDINKVANNELRVMFYRPDIDVFDSGDDAVRYICYMATQSPLLIKSPEVLKGVESLKIPAEFFSKHAVQLAAVFNRHKAIFMAIKNKSNRTAINKISRLSKTKHVPLHEPVSKKLISLVHKNKVNDVSLRTLVANTSIRDKFKILNLLSYKKQQSKMDVFIIRNGKMHVKMDRAIMSLTDISRLESMILESLKSDFQHLDGKSILLDKSVDYGLPVSRKQAIGNLPYGTTVTVHDGAISSGVYWHESGGAYDLDLSTIDRHGERTGWGGYNGYSKSNPVVFSGDVVSAPEGAMEFMTSKDVSYGLFVNIYSGSTGSTCEVVIGNEPKEKKRWIDKVLVREKHALNSRGNIIGFVHGNKYVAYAGRLNNGLVSSHPKNKVVVDRGHSDFWTIQKIFDAIGIKYFLDKEENKEYDFNMSYESFSYDKLESLFSM